uniref:PGRP-LE n=1 Tax=Locusta migratoria TaxID=7004 RepID=A0A1S6M249_LOCMI|nr:PGRP-LE [Locusta migratoria]
MLARDQRAGDGRGDAGGPGGGVPEGHGGGVAEDPPPAVEDCGSDSDADASSWTSSEAADLADDAAPSGLLAAVADAGGVGGVVPFALADPRRHLGPAPTFGNVAVANSTDVQFGNKTFFNGPVTIKQVVYAKDLEDATATAVPAAGTGAAVAHVDPANPDKGGVVAEGVRVTVRPPVVVANGKHANGAAAGASSDSVSGGDCCQIPGFSGAAKTGEGARGNWFRRMWDNPQGRNSTLCAAAALLVLAGGVMSVVSGLITRGGGAADRLPELPKPWDTVETNVTLSGKLKIIPRRDWLARPRSDPPTPLQPPVPYVIVSHSATEGCDSQASCTQMARFIQTFHMESLGWADVGYNFMVGGDGYVYEGRGWTTVGAHTYGYNDRSLGLNMIGTFIKELPPAKQMVALRQLIAMGVSEGYVAENYTLLAHRQLSATESPGTRFFEELMTWPHWSSTP